MEDGGRAFLMCPFQTCSATRTLTVLAMRPARTTVPVSVRKGPAGVVDAVTVGSDATVDADVLAARAGAEVAARRAVVAAARIGGRCIMMKLKRRRTDQRG